MNLDLHSTHERWRSNSDPSINGHLHYPNDLDGPLNETVTDKNLQYHTDYNNRPSNVISFMLAISSTSQVVCIVNLCDFYFCKIIVKLTAFLEV